MALRSTSKSFASKASAKVSSSTVNKSSSLSKANSLLNPTTTRLQPKAEQPEAEQNVDVLYPEGKLPPRLLTTFHLSGENSRSYKHQYANVYYMRLAALKPVVKANAKRVWKDVAGELPLVTIA